MCRSIFRALYTILMTSLKLIKTSFEYIAFSIFQRTFYYFYPVVLKHMKPNISKIFKVRIGAKIRNRYNHVPHLTQNNYGKVTNSQSSTIDESQEVSPYPAGDHNAHINRHAQRHSKMFRYSVLFTVESISLLFLLFISCFISSRR